MSLLLAVIITGQLLNLGSDIPVPLFALLWFLVLFVGMGFLGGGYLLVRGAIRSPNWTPPRE
jgi:hypothetical protein